MFTPMVELIPEDTNGVARVEHFTVSEEDSRFTALRGGESFVPAGRYAKLIVNGILMMSDTRHEQITNYGVVRQSTGNVLIAGLGLGMVLVPILQKPEVQTVTVVEKYADVIGLIKPALQTHLSKTANKKLTIVLGDIYDWRPAPKTKYDVIYFDIWPGQSTDDLESMTLLHKAFRKFRRVGGWMESWNRAGLKARARPGW